MSLSQRLSDFLDFAAQTALQQALSQDIPIAGSALAATASQFAFQTLRDQLDAALGALTPAQLADANQIAAALNSAIPGLASVDAGDVVLSVQESEVVGFSESGGISLGTNPIGLSATGAFTGDLTATLDVTLRYDIAADTLSVEDPGAPTDEISVAANLAAEVAAAASLGLLTLELTDQNPNPELSASIDVDIAAGDVTTLNASDVTTSISGSAALDFRLRTALPGDLLPSIFADVSATWSPTLSAAPEVSFGAVGIEVGELVATLTATLDPLFNILFEGAVGRIVDALITPIPIIDPGLRAIGLLSIFDQIPQGGDNVLNALDILGGYFLVNNNQQSYDILSDVAIALSVLSQLDDLSATGEIILGSFDVDGSGIVSPLDVALDGALTPLEQLGNLLGVQNVFDQALDAVQGLATGGNAQASDLDLTDETGVSFPLFENPERIIDILLPGLTGGDAPEIISYEFPAQMDTIILGPYFFPIFGPIGVTLRGGIGYGLDFRIGYDLTSLQTGEFFDGLFIGVDALPEDVLLPNQNPDERYEHEPLIFSHAEVFAGVGVNAVVAEVAVEGGVTGFAGAFINGSDAPGDLVYDPGSTTDRARLAGLFTNPACFFDPITGRVGAEVVARFTINFFFFSFSWEVTFVETTLVDLRFGCEPDIDPINGLATVVDNGNQLRLNAGIFAANRTINGMPGSDEAENFKVFNARDENGQLTGGLTVQWLDMRQDFMPNPGADIVAVMGERNDSVALDEDVTNRLVASGGDGTDVLIGALGNDSLTGDDGDDRLFGNDGNDTLRGGDDNDLLDGGAGADLLDGGAGIDKVDYHDSDAAIIMQLIGPNIYGVTGGYANGDILVSIEQIIGSAFDDVLFGDFFNDSALEGREGNDALTGFAGDDLLLGGPGADILQGGAGENGTSYVSSWGGVRVDVETGFGFGGDAEGDRLYNIQYIQGSAFDDVIRGTSDNDFFTGFSGNDILEGRGGSDEVDGGPGNDIILALADGDLIRGGSGVDLLSYENFAGFGGLGVEVDLTGGAGALAGFGRELFGAFFANDAIAVETTPGAGLLPDPTGYSFIEDLTGSQFADDLSGDAGRNVIDGLDGNDTMRGRDGNDLLLGGFGADNMDGGRGRDRVDYSAGFAVLVSLAGGLGQFDIAQGDILSNIEDITGTLGADDLTGNDDDNVIEPGLSRDSRLELAPGGQISTNPDIVDGLLGIDTLVIDWAQRDTGGGITSTRTSATGGTFTRLTEDGLATLDEVSFENIEKFVVTGTKSDDSVTLGDLDDMAFMGGGDDFVIAGLGADIVLLHEGDDGVLYRGAAAFIPFGAPPFSGLNQALPLPAPAFWLDGGDGIDSLSLDFSAYAFDITLIGPDVAGEFDGVNFVSEEGGVAERFEQLGLIFTGLGEDVIAQDGEIANIFHAGDNEDILRPGLGTDIAHGGRDYAVGDELEGWTDITVNFGNTQVLVGWRAEQVSTDAVFENEGDLLSLDYSSLTSAVTGTTELVNSGVQVLDLNLQTNQGTYESDDGDVALQFFDIERMFVIGTDFADRLTGTWDTYAPFSGFDTETNFGRGDDVLIGGEDNDSLIGYSGDDILIGGPGDDVLIGGDPSPDGAFRIPGRISNADPVEVDVLSGGIGSDLFVLGVAWRLDAADDIQFGFLYGDAFGGGGDENFAHITDFNATEGDRIQLAGAPGDYLATVIGGADPRVNLFGLNSTNQPDLIARIDGLTGVDLNADFLSSAFIDYVGPTAGGGENRGEGYSGPLPAGGNGPIIIGPPIFQPVLPPINGFDGLNVLADVNAPGAPLQFNTQTLASGLSNTAPLAASAAAPVALQGPSPTPAPQVAALSTQAQLSPASLPPQLQPITDGWARQENNPAALLAALFPGGLNGAQAGSEIVELTGDARAFGVFENDPFGLGSGIGLSTGIFDQIDEPNEIDGGISGPFETPITFVNIGAENGRTLYRADLTNLGVDLNSLQFTDSNSRQGGSSGIFSGFDLDAIALSGTRLDSITGLDLNDQSVLPTLDVFDFTPAATVFEPGTQRTSGPNANVGGPHLFGSVNSIVLPNVATLGDFDATASVATPDGWVTLGDGGSIGFDLTQSVATNMPTYLYVAETGTSVEEQLTAQVVVSNGRLEAPADLSTDFGAPGAEDDTISMTYRFDTAAGFEGGLLTFDFVFFSEELIEWAGSEFNDTVSIKLNGIELGALSNGDSLAVNTLRPAPLAASHPDFIWNPVGVGPIEPGPAVEDTRADGYTRTLSFAGIVQDGENELKLEVRDVRDGFLDSGLLIRGGSAEISRPPERNPRDPREPDDPAVNSVDPLVVINAAGTVLQEGAPPTAVPVSLGGFITSPVTLTFTPNEDVDLGSGAGVAHEVTVEPGDLPLFDLQARAVADGIPEGPEFAVATVSVASADPTWDGLPVAPLLFEINDSTGEPTDLLLGNASTRLSRRAPDAWEDAWTADGATLEWAEDSATPVWSPVNLSLRGAETFGGTGLHRGDLGVSGRSLASEALAQELDGSEAFRVLLADMRASDLDASLSNFTTGDGGVGGDESARFRFFDQNGSLIAEEIVSAADGSSFSFTGVDGTAELIIDAGAEIGGVFVNAALANGAAPTESAASGFYIDSLFFEGETLI